LQRTGQDDLHAGAGVKELVMGLHWHPARPGGPAGAEAANLDALCVAFDRRGAPLEAIHPGRPRNANGSIVHTGDSPTGASTWDDERIFVFLEALPERAFTVSFVVASANGRVFADVPGASCHISDRVTEREWVRLDLSGAFGPHRACRVATVHRDPGGWRITPDAQAMNGATVTELLALPAAGNGGGA
jgi:tellurium resistance protein TerD